MALTLTAIVPRLPPAIDGVGDYALSLARELRESFGINTRFIVGDANWIGADSVEGFQTAAVTQRNPAQLVNSLANADGPLMLHYGGYAYEQRGCPAWLVEGLTTWCAENQEQSLLTIFHELYASGPPWRSSFWLSKRQQNLTRQIALLSEENFTSLNLYENLLREMLGPGGRVARSLPVFSSVGEPSQTPSPLTARRKTLVVFGTPGRRIQVYKRSSYALNRVCRELGVEEILDIGRDIDPAHTRELSVPVRHCGEQDGDSVSDLMLNSIAGIIDYPADMLGKSTIFAAYCAHRMIPIVAGYGPPEPADGLVNGVHFNSIEKGLDLSAGQQLADNAFEWYQQHSLTQHAKQLALVLEQTIREQTRTVSVI